VIIFGKDISDKSKVNDKLTNKTPNVLGFEIAKQGLTILCQLITVTKC
jgi:hypothetical protein